MARKSRLAFAAAMVIASLAACSHESLNACGVVTPSDISSAIHVSDVKAEKAKVNDPVATCHYTVADPRFPGVPGLPMFGITIGLDDDDGYARALRQVPLGQREREVHVDGAEVARLTTVPPPADGVVIPSIELIAGKRTARIEAPTAISESDQEQTLRRVAEVVVARWLTK